MKFGVLRDDVAGNYDEDGYPNYEEFVYAETLDLSMYYDVSTMAYVTEYYEEANLDEDTMKTAVQGIVTEYATDDSWTYDGMRDWEKEFLMEEEWFNIWEYDQSEFGDIAFHEDQEYVIYQEGEVSFDFKEWDFGEPGTTITTRLYCNGANVLIDNMPIDTINAQYINGNTNFVILRNSGIFQAGYINFLTFRYSIVEDNFGMIKDEIRVTIDVVQEHAVGSDSGVTDWRPGKFYRQGDDIIYNLVLYNCIEAHTSTTEFEREKWEQEGGISQEDADLFVEILRSGSAE